MRGGFQIAVVRGIPVRVHWSLLVVLPFLAYGFGSSLGVAARLAGMEPGILAGPPWLWGLGIAVALFLSVLVHELAHSIYAISRGGKVRGITLLMIGGVSEIAEPPRTPRQEAAMAFAGPASSFGIALLALAGAALLDGLELPSASFALFHLGYLNGLLAVFNLLPAFPMDGGRVLRGLLTPRLGAVRATRLAARIGKGFALLFAGGGVLGANPLLLVIALFVFAGADAESKEVLLRSRLGDLTVGALMTRGGSAVQADDLVWEAAERMLREQRLALPVLEDGGLAGVLTVEAIEAVPPGARASTLVRAVMRPPVFLRSADRVSDALRLLDREGLQEIAVEEGGTIAGTLSRLDITRGLRLRELEASQRASRGS